MAIVDQNGIPYVRQGTPHSDGKQKELTLFELKKLYETDPKFREFVERTNNMEGMPRLFQRMLYTNDAGHLDRQDDKFYKDVHNIKRRVDGQEELPDDKPRINSD